MGHVQSGIITMIMLYNANLWVLMKWNGPLVFKGKENVGENGMQFTLWFGVK